MTTEQKAKITNMSAYVALGTKQVTKTYQYVPYYCLVRFVTREGVKKGQPLLPSAQCYEYTACHRGSLAARQKHRIPNTQALMP